MGYFFCHLDGLIPSVENNTKELSVAVVMTQAARNLYLNVPRTNHTQSKGDFSLFILEDFFSRAPSSVSYRHAFASTFSP